MKPIFKTKAAARQAVWDHLQASGVARFPFPPHNRIPNFAGAREAAWRLFTIEPWKTARRLKINPDAPQRFVREEALKRGIAVYVPTPRLRSGFMCLDPCEIPAERLAEAATLSGWRRWAKPIPVQALPQLDAIVCGSVAVTREGRRCGKGEGYSDLEYAILRELGHPAVPVATTVHPLQVVAQFPAGDLDLPLSVIVTPKEVIRIRSPHSGPTGIAWDRLTDEDLARMPVLRQLNIHGAEGLSGPSRGGRQGHRPTRPSANGPCKPSRRRRTLPPANPPERS